MKTLVFSKNTKEISIEELINIDTSNNPCQTIGADINYCPKIQEKFLSAFFAILITSNTPLFSNSEFIKTSVQSVKTISNLEDVGKLIESITPVEYPIIKTRKVLIDDEENRIEENILNTYISVVGDFINSRKKKISL